MTSHELHTSPSKFPWKLATVLYGISFAPQLLSANSLFWDDWVMFDPQTGNLLEELYSVGGNAPWRKFIEMQLFQSSPSLFRIASFFIYFFLGYFIFRILKHSPHLNQVQLSVITLLFILLPVNSARISIACSKYAIDAFFFFFAWFMYESSKKRRYQFLSLLFFFFSYSTLPFPTFTILPLLYSFYIAQVRTIAIFKRQVLRSVPLILLPAVYLLLRQIYWPPTGGSAIMYSPQLLGLIRALLFITLCSIPLLYCLLPLKYQKFGRSNVLVLVGVFSVSIAAFPYMVGGHLVDISDWLIAFIPNFSDWNSRHQLLLPLGFALIIGGSLKLDSTKPLRWNSSPVLSTIVACCVVLNVAFAQEYFLDGKKQDSIMTAMANNEDLKNASAILIDDSAVRFNARGRLIRSYEWEGMLQKVFGENSRKVSYLQYVNCAEFQPDAILRISAPNGRLESTLRRNVAIDISVEQINPCGN